MPSDRVLSGLMLGRTPTAERMSHETSEIFNRLLRAHLNLEQAHEYLRQRFAKVRGQEAWSLNDVFSAADQDLKGSLTVYDLEKLIIEQKRGGSRTLVDEIELLIGMYDRSGYKKINFVDFQNELVPRLER